MSIKAIAQNATELSISTPSKIDYSAIVERYAIRAVKGATRENIMLNGSKLFSTSAEYIRSLMGIEKRQQLPQDIATELWDAIDVFIKKHINRLQPDNITSLRRGFAYKSAEEIVVDRITMIGENILLPKEQAFGLLLLINSANERLNRMQMSNNRNTEKEHMLSQHIAKMEKTRSNLLATLEEEKKRTTEQTNG